MSTEHGDSSAKAATVVLGEIMRMAGDDPKAKAAASELGKTALTLTKAVNNALLPLAALNYGIEEAKKYFSTKFQSDITEKAQDIPPDSLVEPKASLAGPALQGLAFAHEEKELREMFLNLLASAMDKRRMGQAHPAFVEVIKQLSQEEAQLLNGVLRIKNFAPVGELRLVEKDNSRYEVVARHVLDMRANGSPVAVPGLQSMVENWIRLGLINVDYNQQLAADDVYAFLAARPEISGAVVPPDSSRELKWQRGILHSTEFGRIFATSVGIREQA